MDRFTMREVEHSNGKVSTVSRAVDGERRWVATMKTDDAEALVRCREDLAEAARLLDEFVADASRGSRGYDLPAHFDDALDLLIRLKEEGVYGG